MANSALQIATEEFAELPRIPQFAPNLLSKSSALAERRRAVVSGTDEFVAFAQARLERTAAIRERMIADYAALKTAKLDGEEMLHGLDKLIAVIDGQVARSKADLENHVSTQKEAIRSVTSRLPVEARFVQTQSTKFLEAATSIHNDLVDYYYFLLSLRADYDPEARGGPQFDDPQALNAYIRAQLK